MRSSFNITLAEIKAARAWNWLPSDNVIVDPAIVEYSKNHTQKECYLYNNRIFAMFIHPSQERKDEYNANYNFIKSLTTRT